MRTILLVAAAVFMNFGVAYIIAGFLEAAHQNRQRPPSSWPWPPPSPEDQR